MTEPCVPVPERNAADFEPLHDDVFSRIAERYDLLCDLFSLGIHRSWKRRMARRIAELPWTQMIDVAAGTGDISLRVARMTRLSADRRCLVTDVCPKMLQLARRKGASTTLEFCIANAHDLDVIASSSVDLYASSLGMKICDRRKAIEQALRVLKPGGYFLCLEASRIRPLWLHRAYLAYMSVCMPTLGWIATWGDASVYAYLLRGVREFPDAEYFAREIEQHGFERVSYEHLTLGIVAIHVARKPAPFVQPTLAQSMLTSFHSENKHD